MDQDPRRNRVGPSSDHSSRSKSQPVTLKVLVIADLAPDCEVGPLPIDRLRFAELMSELSPRLDFSVPNALGTGAEEISCSLRFAKQNAFRPDQVVHQIPLLADLLRGREVLAACAAGETPIEGLREALPLAFHASDLGQSVEKALSQPARVEAPTATAGTPPASRPPADADDDSPIDDLLSKVELPTGTAEAAAPSTDLVNSIASCFFSGDSRVKVDRETLSGVVEEIDRRLTSQLSLIIGNRGVRNLEAAWLGLKFLIERADFKKRVLVEVLPAGKDGFLEAFHEKVFHREYDGTADPPLALVVGDFAFDRSPGDLEALQHMARMAQSLQVPFLASMGPEFWGLEQAGLLATLPNLLQRTEAPEFAAWNRFRGDEASMWVCLAVNRLLLRDKWGGEGPKIKSFQWMDTPGPDDNRPLWGSPALGLAAAVAQAYAEEGARLPVVGPSPPALLCDMQLRIPVGSGGRQLQPLPVESLLSDTKILELSRSGFAPLVALPGKDSAFFAAMPSVFSPEKAIAESGTRQSFSSTTPPFRIFSGMAARELQRAVRGSGGLDPVAIADEVKSILLDFLAGAEDRPEADEIQVLVEANEENPQVLDVGARLKPRFTIYGEEVDFVVSTQVAR